MFPQFRRQPDRFRRPRRALAACAALACVSLGPVSAAGEARPLLVRVERRGADDLRHLLEAGVPVVMELNPCFLVRADAGVLERLRTFGYGARILDDQAEAADHVLAGLRPDSNLEAALRFGSVVHHEENWLLLRVPRGTPLAALAPARLHLTRVPRRTLEPPRAAPLEAPPAGEEAGLQGAADPIVSKIVAQVDPQNIDQLWQDLTENPPTGTRYSTHQGCRDAAAYCLNYYTSLDVPAEYHEWSTEHAPNVVATIEGAIHPERIYIVEGHLDDLPATPPAPGADDNASGSVNVLESARVMSCWAFENTVRFLNVTGEEFGLYGSDAYAEEAYNRGDDILGVINMDMIGWEGDGSPVPENLDLNYNGPSQWLGERFAEAATKYDTGLVVDAFYCPSLTASDHYPFWQRGYHAICGITDNEGYCGHGGNYPYYHTSDDTIPNCGDPSFFYAVVRTSVATLAELAEPFKITFARPAYTCGATLRVVVGDRDLDTDPSLAETVDVEVWSDTEPDPEIVTLTERDTHSMLFEGTIPTTLDPPVAGDGVLSIAPGGTLGARYVDALDCDGAAGVTYETTAAVDCDAPLISDVSEQDVTDTQATIVWTTDEDASSVVHWGEATPPSQTASAEGLTTSHSVTLTGLQACTVYYYAVESADVAGNTALDDNAGAYYRFETYGDFGSGLQPCHEGRVQVDAKTWACSAAFSFQVTDMDLNADPLAPESVELSVTSSTETEPEWVTAVETGPSTSVFRGSIPLAPGAPAPDGTLQVADGDVLTVTYRDADDGTGSPATSFDTATVDCAGPAIRNLRVTDMTDQRFTVRFQTDEAGDATVKWGFTPALGEVVQDLTMATAHAVVLNRLDRCQPVYLRVSSTDALGNTTVADLAGEPHVAHTWDIPGLYWQETFEGDTSGWTLTGEWQVGRPQGLGGSSGYPDPAGAYNHDFALGTDLDGLGAYPGDYEHATTDTATSPTLDARNWTNTKLLVTRQLNVRDDDRADLLTVVHNKETPIDSSAGQTVSEQGWTTHAYDVSAQVDGQRSVNLRFVLVADSQQPFFDDGVASGWNVDDIILKDGTLPDFAPCGGCTTPPSFGGATRAADNDACGGGGVTVEWEPAVAWGSGGGGTYAIYRDTVPDFVPSAANLLAAGVSGTSHLDAAAPADTVLYYHVRAENDETCGSGPNNNGLTDANTAYVQVRETTSQPVPPEVTGVGADFVNRAHVRLSWDPVEGAVRYRIYRATAPDDPAGFTLIGETEELVFEDLDQGANAWSYYYEVRAVNACGTEGP